MLLCDPQLSTEQLSVDMFNTMVIACTNKGSISMHIAAGASFAAVQYSAETSLTITVAFSGVPGNLQVLIMSINSCHNIHLCRNAGLSDPLFR